METEKSTSGTERYKLVQEGVFRTIFDATAMEEGGSQPRAEGQVNQADVCLGEIRSARNRAAPSPGSASANASSTRTSLRWKRFSNARREDHRAEAATRSITKPASAKPRACVTPPPKPRGGGREGGPVWNDLPNVPRSDRYAQAQNECNAVGAVPRFDSATNRYDCECSGNTDLHNGACTGNAEAIDIECRGRTRASRGSRSSSGYVCRCSGGTEPDRSGTAHGTCFEKPRVGSGGGGGAKPEKTWVV